MLGRRWSAASLCVLLLAAPGVRAQDKWVNPGTMGPNALPTFPGESARGHSDLIVRLSAAGQLTSRGDRSFVPYFRIEAPFGRYVTMISEGRPVELWRVSPRTRETWRLDRSEGVTGGDLSFGVKFLFLDGGERWPSFAARNMTKTTTGKGYWERRHTNAPAYLLDLLATQPLGTLWGAKAEVWGAFGFFAWQQGRNGQNDAYAYSATAALRWPGESSLRAEIRGYTGWESGDKPLVVAAAAEWAMSRRVSLSATANVGLKDAPALDAHLGIVLRLPALIPLTLGEGAGQ